MCSTSGLVFCLSAVKPEQVVGKRVIEVGSQDVNGSVRDVIKGWNPAEYIGVDMAPGKGVDRVVEVSRLVEVFSPGSFDVVISTEMMEHVRDWQTAISNIKRVAAPGGLVIITTRSQGFPFHAYPYDFWRYQIEDMKAIFSDFIIERLEPDTADPGIFLCARKPADFVERDLSGYQLFNMLSGTRSSHIQDADFKSARYRSLVFRMKLLERLRGVARALFPQIA